MSNTNPGQVQSIETLEIRRDIEIQAPIDIVFQTVLDQMSTECEMPDGKPYPMKLEPWPGGRWYRDLGNNTGHLWGHVQVIKPPTLVEIWGPLMMSYPAVNHLQYRLKADQDKTRLEFLHRGMGAILPDHREGMPKGWTYWVQRIAEVAQRRSRKQTM